MCHIHCKLLFFKSTIFQNCIRKESWGAWWWIVRDRLSIQLGRFAATFSWLPMHACRYMHTYHTTKYKTEPATNRCPWDWHGDRATAGRRSSPTLDNEEGAINQVDRFNPIQWGCWYQPVRSNARWAVSCLSSPSVSSSWFARTSHLLRPVATPGRRSSSAYGTADHR